ncbi:O-antigen ligase domain-containing protein [Hymenobacter aquaticus]|uniref:O-antigen ligase domain-containing protein n=1 Tax=Hymenobacter aquaticus TaxID=1867101 RepID=A0A4Z0PZJ3_9BACT|nr:O-antigen ligase family protein [Hymenobacter aquaticus]TGE21882.1 O-antigen ligase domain-containing protein [Hymenobacter aquaticus]
MMPSVGWSAFRRAYQDGRLSQYLLVIACLAGVVGLFAARALVSLSPVAGVVAALLNPDLRRQIPRWLRNGAAIRLALLYALLLLSGLYTSAWDVWRHELFRQLPLLGVPLAFALAVPLSRQQRYAVGCFFTVGVALIGAFTLGKYLLNPAQANLLINQGQNIPSVTRIFHIHFSIMLVLAVYFGFLLQREASAPAALRWLLRLSVLLCVVVLHVLAYRTGLLALYATLLADVVLTVVLNRRFVVGLGLLACLVVVPLAAYWSLPSMQRRVGGSVYDVEQFANGHDINNSSLSQRLAAWQTAQRLAGRNPWLGVGPADTYDAMMREYEWHDYGLRPENRAMIHNQYLHYLVASGLVGLFLWLLVLLTPLLQPALRQNPYVVHFLVIMAVAMLVDSLLEVQIGFNLFVFLYGFLVVSTERQVQMAQQNPA